MGSCLKTMGNSSLFCFLIILTCISDVKPSVYCHPVFHMNKSWKIERQIEDQRIFKEIRSQWRNLKKVMVQHEKFCHLLNDEQFCKFISKKLKAAYNRFKYLDGDVAVSNTIRF